MGGGLAMAVAEDIKQKFTYFPQALHPSLTAGLSYKKDVEQMLQS